MPRSVILFEPYLFYSVLCRYARFAFMTVLFGALLLAAGSLCVALVRYYRTYRVKQFDRLFDLTNSNRDRPWPGIDLHEALRLCDSTVQMRRAYANQVVGSYALLRTRASSPIPDVNVRYVQRLLRERVFTPDWILTGKSDFIRQYVWQCEHLPVCLNFDYFCRQHPGDMMACREYALNMRLDEPLPCSDFDVFVSEWLTLKRVG